MFQHDPITSSEKVETCIRSSSGARDAISLGMGRGLCEEAICDGHAIREQAIRFLDAVLVMDGGALTVEALLKRGWEMARASEAADEANRPRTEQAGQNAEEAAMQEAERSAIATAAAAKQKEDEAKAIREEEDRKAAAATRQAENERMTDAAAAAAEATRLEAEASAIRTAEDKAAAKAARSANAAAAAMRKKAAADATEKARKLEEQAKAIRKAEREAVQAAAKAAMDRRKTEAEAAAAAAKRLEAEARELRKAELKDAARAAATAKKEAAEAARAQRRAERAGARSKVVRGVSAEASAQQQQPESAAAEPLSREEEMLSREEEMLRSASSAIRAAADDEEDVAAEEDSEERQGSSGRHSSSTASNISNQRLKRAQGRRASLFGRLLVKNDTPSNGTSSGKPGELEVEKLAREKHEKDAKYDVEQGVAAALAVGSEDEATRMARKKGLERAEREAAEKRTRQAAEVDLNWFNRQMHAEGREPVVDVDYRAFRRWIDEFELADRDDLDPHVSALMHALMLTGVAIEPAHLIWSPDAAPSGPHLILTSLCPSYARAAPLSIGLDLARVSCRTGSSFTTTGCARPSARV